MLSVMSVISLAYLYPRIHIHPFFFVTDSNTFLAVVVAVSSFLFFINLNLGQNKMVNTIAASTFEVLMIHANSDTMRQWLWKDTLNNVGMYQSAYCCLYAMIAVIMVFVICSVIDYLRIRFIERPFFSWWDYNESKISMRYKKFEKIMFRLFNHG